MSRRLPLIVVLGATGCGKSKLAIDLATRFGGEIISADSMQVYKGLDIVTNKVTSEEQLQAKHHMMNLIDPLQSFSVVDFQSKALAIIDKLQKNNSLPIVVGGTNYYIESLVWSSFLIGSKATDIPKVSSDDTTEEDTKTLIDQEVKLQDSLPEGSVHSEEDCNDPAKFFEKPIYFSSFKNMDSEKLWKILEHVDPETAHKFHPKNRRAVIRFLQIYQSRGIKYSELLRTLNKSSQTGKSSLGGPLRFDNTCIIWLHCEDSALQEFVDSRVDQMLKRGLLGELQNFHDLYNKQRVLVGQKSDYKLGIFQTIGFKEFHKYLMLNHDQRETEDGKNILKECVLEMKISTKRYIKRQMKWIRARFLREGIRDLPPIYKLTTTFDEDKWTQQVREPAFRIVQCLLENLPLSDDLLKLKAEKQNNFIKYEPGKFYCESCDRIFVGNTDITNHLASKRHKKSLSNSTSKKRKPIEECVLNKSDS